MRSKGRVWARRVARSEAESVSCVAPMLRDVPGPESGELQQSSRKPYDLNITTTCCGGQFNEVAANACCVIPISFRFL
jgi:hypothetical protein